MTANKFDIVVWMRETGPSPLCATSCSAGSEPEQSTSYDGMVDLHWGFSSLVDAERMAASLSRVTSWPEIVLLRLSNHDNPGGSVTYKDEQFTRHQRPWLSCQWIESNIQNRTDDA